MSASPERLLSAFHADERGATATEYIVLLILIACFVIAIVQVFGETVSYKFRTAHEYVTKMLDY